MEKKKQIIKPTLFLLLSFIIGCGTTKQFDYAAYAKQCIEAFTNTTDTFFKKDYYKAKDLLINYNQLDSTTYDYESYAFLAECYNQLGLQDSGKIVFEKIINKLKNDAKEKPQKSANTKLAIKVLEKWYSDYPDFPEVLKKENGFVPYDDLPKPIGGVSGIQKNVTYPSGGKKGEF